MTENQRRKADKRKQAHIKAQLSVMTKAERKDWKCT